MTISVQSNINTYTANGVLTTFAYTFKIFNDSDLTVTTITTAGVTTSYTLDVDYTVTGAPGTGNVVFTVAPTDTDTVVVLGTYDYLQSTDYIDGDSFPAVSHENALDKLTMLAIKAEQERERTVQFPVTYTDGVVAIEAPVTGRFLQWSLDGLGSDEITNAEVFAVVTFESLLANGDIGSGATQLPRGSSLASVSGTVDTNTTNIATNVSNIASNVVDIATNASGIGVNTAAIAVLNLNDSSNEVLVSGTTSVAVTLSPVQSDTDYYITANMKNTTDAPTYYNTCITTTTTSGFTVSFSAAIDSANYSLDWALTR